MFWVAAEQSCCQKRWATDSSPHTTMQSGASWSSFPYLWASARRFNVSLSVTTSPHCFNSFENRYGDPSFKAQHYSQLLAALIDEGKLKLSGSFQKTVTYHDPCFLGMHNGVYDEPRRVLEAVPGLSFVELDRSRERSLCCEGGGGRMWVEIPGERLAERRVRGAVDVGAEVIASACPFCLSTLEDAVLTAGLEGSVEVMDIAEIVVKAL